MNELVTRCIEDGDISFLGSFPTELMSDKEIELVNFIITFDRKYEKPPSVKRVMDSFPSFIPFKFTPTKWEPDPPTLLDLNDQTLLRKMITIAERKTREAEIILRDDGRIPLEIYGEIERIHTMSLGVNKYSTFNRDLYFRKNGMEIPFNLINKSIGGINNGDFMLIVGRLGTGKSIVAQYIAKYLWERGKKILFVSAEMLSLDVFSRIDAMVGKFNPLDLRKGKTKEMAETLASTLKKVKKGEGGEIIIPRSRLLSPAQISSFAKNLDVDIIIVDGAYLLKPNDGHFGSKWEKVATVSNELKQIALDLELPLIATAQIKRGASGDDGYTPEDIALSDALGQDSDFVLAINPNKTIKERAELQLIKNRFGGLCATQAYIDFETMTITDETIAGAVKDAKAPKPKKVSIEDWGGRGHTND